MMIAEFKLFLKKELVERQGKTIVLATHQLQEAEQLCDRIAIMNRGRCVAVGRLEELQLMKFGRPRADFPTSTGAKVDVCHTSAPSLEQVFVHFATDQHGR
jgi:ABC-type multidrug transport system ATPase subunit